MLNGRNLFIDNFAETYQLLKPHSTGEFWSFVKVVPEPNSIYVLGRQQLVENINRVISMCEDPNYVMVFSGSAEGSSPLVSQLEMLKIKELVLAGKLLLIGGGDMEAEYPHLVHEHFLTTILGYQENIEAMDQSDEIYQQTDKPYTFMFLNGRSRPHRKYLWEILNARGLLDRSLWTMLDSRPCVTRNFDLVKDSIDLMATVTPLRWLPSEYEVDRFAESTIDPGPPQRSFVKNQLFNNLWGEIYLKPKPYIDTYFSLVTETVFDYPYSFRTEKIAKPIAMAHPWIAATNAGFYRDIRNLGFQTFDGIIDESFDSIDNHQDRMDRIADVVDDLCRQDLKSFLSSCYNICKYNQQFLHEFAAQHREQFSNRFFNFIQPYIS